MPTRQSQCRWQVCPGFCRCSYATYFFSVSLTACSFAFLLRPGVAFSLAGATFLSFGLNLSTHVFQISSSRLRIVHSFCFSGTPIRVGISYKAHAVSLNLSQRSGLIKLPVSKPTIVRAQVVRAQVVQRDASATCATCSVRLPSSFGNYPPLIRRIQTVTVKVSGTATASAAFTFTFGGSAPTPTASPSAIGNFGQASTDYTVPLSFIESALGSCTTPQIEFGAGFDGRKETSFRPVDRGLFNRISRCSQLIQNNSIVQPRFRGYYNNNRVYLQRIGQYGSLIPLLLVVIT